MQEIETPFDPGFAGLVHPFSDNISACNGIIGSLKSMHQKKFKFKILHPQMHKLIENNVAFYYGCLLWAYYLSNAFKDSHEISGNPFYEMNDKDLEEYGITYDVDYLINYLPKFENDTKYYLGKAVNIPEKWLTILNQYREFILLNNGFQKVKMTSDIKLPENLLPQLSTEEIKNAIYKSIESKTIEDLLNL